MLLTHLDGLGLEVLISRSRQSWWNEWSMRPAAHRSADGCYQHSSKGRQGGPPVLRSQTPDVRPKIYAYVIV